MPRQNGRFKSRARHFNHHPQKRHPVPDRDVSFPQIRRNPVQNIPGGQQLADRRNHGQQDADVTKGARPKRRRELRFQKRGKPQGIPDTAHPQRRIRADPRVQNLGAFVPADVKGTESDRFAFHARRHVAERLELLVFRRQIRTVHEHVFATQKTDAVHV